MWLWLEGYGKAAGAAHGRAQALCVCFTVGACTHPSCNVIAILRAIGVLRNIATGSILAGAGVLRLGA